MSMAMKVLLTTAILFSVSVSANAKDAALAADAQAIDNACKTEAAAAGCGQEVVGKGLLKCMGSYKKAHKDFKFSDGCRSAMKQMRQDKKAGK